MHLLAIDFTEFFFPDLSDTAIRQMNHLHKSARPDLIFEKMDATNTVYEDDDFNVVLDKGTYTVWKFGNFLPLRFYVKSTIVNVGVPKTCYLIDYTDLSLLFCKV